LATIRYIYCIPCRQTLFPGQSSCQHCGGTKLACLDCHRDLPAGRSTCPHCSTDLVTVDFDTLVSRDPAHEALATIPAAVAHASLVPEVYQGGRHGVSAEVQIPPRDAAIMNELLQLVQLLHGMAGRLNQFAGLTEHTRKLIRDMRVLACDAQEEVEMRRGPT
jgi:RNA polymerase subunit RPABC4/transcription elongation factor Spt4